MIWTQAKLLSAAVTVLAVMVCLYTGILTARMRSRHGVKAPAVTGASKGATAEFVAHAPTRVASHRPVGKLSLRAAGADVLLELLRDVG